MRKARQLARYHRFTRGELYQILKDALEDKSKSFWKKPSKCNKIFDNGYYFNRCVEWLDYQEGKNDDTYPHEIVVCRILDSFSEYSKVQIPKKEKVIPKLQGSEEPKL